MVGRIGEPRGNCGSRWNNLGVSGKFRESSKNSRSRNAAAELGDYGTRDFLQFILNDEEAHLDWIETQLEQIRQIDIQNYLVEQM